MTNPVKAFEAALHKAEADPVKALAAEEAYNKTSEALLKVTKAFNRAIDVNASAYFGWKRNNDLSSEREYDSTSEAVSRLSKELDSAITANEKAYGEFKRVKRVRQSPPGSKTAGKYDKQDAHKALTIALRELNNAASTIYYRVRGEGSERNPRVPGTGMAFSPEDMRTLLKAEKQIREAQELASSASRAIDDIDLGMHDRYDSYDDPL